MVAQAQETIPPPRAVARQDAPKLVPVTTTPQEDPKKEEEKKKPRQFPFPKLKKDDTKKEDGKDEPKKEEPKKNDEEPKKGDEPKKQDDEPKKDDESKKKDEPKKKDEELKKKDDEPKKEEPKKKEEIELPPLKKPTEEPKKEEPKKEEPKKEEPKAEEKKDEPKEPEWKKGLDEASETATTALKGGDTAWMLVASAFVMLMVPGLALFYCGMVRRKNVLATMMHSFAALAVVGVYWVAIGYSLAFGPSIIKIDLLGVEGGGVIGFSPDLIFLKGIKVDDLLTGYNIPVYLHVLFQGMFAIITPALISGALAERIRFWPFCIFMILWVTFVYCPLAHMVWAFDWFATVPVDPFLGKGGSAIGLLGILGAWDFAGGTVVHIAAGVAGLACCLVLRRRKGYPQQVIHPNSMVLTLLGAGLLWFGWFGFNGGSGLKSSALGVSAFAATQIAAAGAGLSWIFVEWIFKGKPTALGLASGIVAGLVAVTPASGYVEMWGGLLIGLIAGVVCYFSVQLKNLLGYDDSLDAFGVHAVGGFLGAVLTGFLCYGTVQGLDSDNISMDGYFAVKEYTKKAESLKADIAEVEKEIAANKAELDKVTAEYDDLNEKYEKASDAEKDGVKEKLAPVFLKKLELEVPSERLKALQAEQEFAAAKVKAFSDADSGRNAMTQPIIQFKAAVFSTVYAFVLSLALAILVQIITLGNFTTTAEEENVGLDRTEHGEVGFDFGVAGESLSTSATTEPRAAKMPPGSKRFDIVIDGIDNGGLMHAWNELCQPAQEGKPVDADFKAVYPYVTTVQGNRFRFRGGDAKMLAAHVQRLFMKKLGKRELKVRIEE